jgi:tryptophan synthase alpha chain
MRTSEATRTGIQAVAHAFEQAHLQSRAALITYLTIGYPTPEATPGLVHALQAGGADLIELGVPHSDPVADGPAIQRASQVALQAGVTPRSCLEQVQTLRRAGVTVPLLLMGYYNPILNYGLAEYARDCHEAGVDGLIVPDLPLEEADALAAACAQHGLALVYLVAPTTSEARLARLAAATSGFLYVVSRLGTTGTGRAPTQDLDAHLALARRYARTPIAVGFGISQPDQVRALRDKADGIIVGSALVERAVQGPQALQELVASLKAALALS